ncbi:hypothetical protein BGX23_000522 [Mortierella sp. AD031]|nr:hypothetical protein BGX23_000522 [Mortierella sp. AD031]KAG0211660.1 hypothetical protein BGX33_004129 [Mortierella sp. NVP41]
MVNSTTSERGASREPSVPLKEQKGGEAVNSEATNDIQPTTTTDDKTTHDQIDNGEVDTDKTEGETADRTEAKAEEKTVTEPEHKSEDRSEGKAEDKANDDEDKANNDENVEEEEEEKEEEEEEYEVERVVGHKRVRGLLKYNLKWKGYSEDDNTWEKEDGVFCTDLVEEYWTRYEQAGGSRTDLNGADGVAPKQEAARQQKPKSPAPPKATKATKATASTAGRGSRKDRDGDTVMEIAPAKRQKTSSTHKKSRKADEGGAESVDENKWMPPKSWVSWEDRVDIVQTVERCNQKLQVRLIWNNGKETQHPIEAAHQKCPQKLIQFYESHIKFSQA